MLNAYVINLKERNDRYEKISKQFKNLKTLQLQRFDALKSNSSTRNISQKTKVFDGNIFDDNSSWKYCGLSHLEIIKQNMHKNENILILEDDCEIKNLETFDEKWSQIKIWLDNNLDKWDIFTGGSTYVEYSSNILNLNNNLNIFQIEKSGTTHFIYYNKISFDKILKWNPENNIQIDKFYKWNSDIKILTCYPFLAIQYESYSDIVNKNTNYYYRFKNSENHLKKFIKF